MEEMARLLGRTEKFYIEQSIMYVKKIVRPQNKHLASIFECLSCYIAD